MSFSAEALGFMNRDCDRLASLAAMLEARGLGSSVLQTEAARHLVLRLGTAAPSLILVAHYDRAAGSPGALDNSCACLQLVDFAGRLAAMNRELSASRDLPRQAWVRQNFKELSLLIVFTDAEEAPGSGPASDQGAFALAKRLKEAWSRLEIVSPKNSPASSSASGLRALVFDVTGRGDRLVISTASEDLMLRTGMSDPSARAARKSLVSLSSIAARLARLPSPLELPMPWSDDLGFTLGGIPSLTISLLPADEVQQLAEGKRPATWDLLHTAGDCPERAEARSFEIMAAFFNALAESLRSQYT